MKLTFLNGPLDATKQPPKRLQIFATYDDPKPLPDQRIEYRAGCYVLDHQDAEETVMSWQEMPRVEG